jgi:hypothetical protein
MNQMGWLPGNCLLQWAGCGFEIQEKQQLQQTIFPHQGGLTKTKP